MPIYFCLPFVHFWLLLSIFWPFLPTFGCFWLSLLLLVAFVPPLPSAHPLCACDRGFPAVAAGRVAQGGPSGRGERAAPAGGLPLPTCPPARPPAKPPCLWEATTSARSDSCQQPLDGKTSGIPFFVWRMVKTTSSAEGFYSDSWNL